MLLNVDAHVNAEDSGSERPAGSAVCDARKVHIVSAQVGTNKSCELSRPLRRLARILGGKQ
jgi:hypothetical protein